MRAGQVADFWIRFSNSGTETWQRGVWGRQANLGFNGDNKLPYRLGMAVNSLWGDRIPSTTAETAAAGERPGVHFPLRRPLQPWETPFELRPAVHGEAG